MRRTNGFIAKITTVGAMLLSAACGGMYPGQDLGSTTQNIDPASEAAASQTSGGYSVDTWMNVRLQPMVKVWQGIGGHSNFFVSSADVRGEPTTGDTDLRAFAKTLSRFAQSRPAVKEAFRDGLREYVVDVEAAAALGRFSAALEDGEIPVWSYYIPNWQEILTPTGYVLQRNESNLYF